MTEKHTPGPWVIAEARSTKVDLINTRKGAAVGEVVFVDVRNPADALLVAAAPDLLDSLIYLRNCIEDGTTPAMREVNAAIAKATGSTS